MNNTQFQHITLQQLEILVGIIEEGSFSGQEKTDAYTAFDQQAYKKP